MAEKTIDLLTLFSSVSKTLKENQAALNESDTMNHNHGDNMVKNFQVINKALKRKKSAPVSEQLAFASQKLAKSSSTASAQLYAQNLAQAADQMKGQPELNSRNAMSLIQALMGGHSTAEPAQPGSGDLLGSLLGTAMGGQPASAPEQSGSGDLLGSLLGAAMGGQPASAPEQSGSGDLLGSLLGAAMGGQPASTPAQSGSGDWMGSLLGSLLGGGQTAASQQSTSSGQSGGGLDLGTLLSAGMAYMNATQNGASPLEGLVQAVMAGSQMNNSAHHAQSGQLVAQTLINTLGSLLGGK